MNSLGLSVPFILLGGILAWISIYFWRSGRDLSAAGVEARAAITQKFRKPGDTFLLGLENYFVLADFIDVYGFRRTIDIRVPSRQWHWLRAGTTETILYLPSNPQRARVISRAGQAVISAILIFTTSVGALFVIFGIFFIAIDLPVGVAKRATAGVADPPPSKFDKSGVAHVAMLLSPRHDRIAAIDEDNGDLRIRELPSGTVLASVQGRGWRMLGWRPDGARIAVAEGRKAQVLDAASLKLMSGEDYSWNPEAPQLAGCTNSTPVWDAARTQAAAACGNDIMVVDPTAARLLRGHRDRVLGVAWSPTGRRLASVSEDNYVRVWDPRAQQSVDVSEDYPYPRAIYFSDDDTVVVIDVALRQYILHTTR